MDDKNFNQATAAEWMRIIESPGASIRENDIYPVVKEWLYHSSAENVLDIGCGQGICSIHLGKFQAAYVGIDPSPDLISRAQELYFDSNRKFAVGNVYEMPCPDSYFGAAFSIAVWHLLSDITKASNELRRVLKPQGKFLIITADPNQYQSWTDQYKEKSLNGSTFVGTNLNADGTVVTDTLYLHPMEEIVTQLEDADLSISKTQTIRSFIAISGHKR